MLLGNVIGVVTTCFPCSCLATVAVASVDSLQITGAKFSIVFQRIMTGNLLSRESPALRSLVSLRIGDYPKFCSTVMKSCLLLFFSFANESMNA